MSDRIKGFVVTLKEPASEEYADRFVDIIRMISGVATVEPSTDTCEDQMNRSMVRHELSKKLWEVLK